MSFKIVIFLFSVCYKVLSTEVNSENNKSNRTKIISNLNGKTVTTKVESTEFKKTRNKNLWNTSETMSTVEIDYRNLTERLSESENSTDGQMDQNSFRKKDMLEFDDTTLSVRNPSYPTANSFVTEERSTKFSNDSFVHSSNHYRTNNVTRISSIFSQPTLYTETSNTPFAENKFRISSEVMLTKTKMRTLTRPYETWGAVTNVANLYTRGTLITSKGRDMTTDSMVSATNSTTVPPKIAETIASLSSRDPCVKRGTCEYLSELPLQYQYCHCDNDCVDYGDCCVNSNFSSTSEKTQLQFSCAPVEKTNMLKNIVGIFVIDKCPYSYRFSETETKCQHNLTSTGPYVVDRNGTIYKNRHCAECHGVTNFKIFSVKITSIDEQYVNTTYLGMTPMEYLAICLSDPEVEYELIAPKQIKGRPCIVTEFNENPTKECTDYVINPVLSHLGISVKKVYRNQFCKKRDANTCFGTYARRFIRYRTYQLSVMFSFSVSNDASCDTGEQKVDEICQIAPKYSNYTTDISFRLVFRFSLPDSVLDQVLVSLLSSISVHDQLVVNRDIALNVSVNSTQMAYLVQIRLKILKSMLANELLLYQNKLKNFRWKSYLILEQSNSSVEIYTEQLAGEFPSPSGFSVSWKFLNDRADQAKIKETMKEERVNYNWSDDIALCSDISVSSISADQMLIIKHVTCMEDQEYMNPFSVTDVIRQIITYVGCSLSVFALIVSITVSRKIQISNSVPGKNLENLSCSLALSNALFMLGIGANDHQKVCYVLGIILHYLWLVSFSFMSISVIYIFQNLTKIVVNESHRKSDKSCRKYVPTILGLIIPVVFVLPSVLLDSLDVPKFSAIYDGSVCFPTGYLSNAIFVSGPITLSVGVNSLCLILIIVYVARHNMKMNDVRKSQSFQQGKVYLRICAFSGLFWITGILSAVFKSDLIDYVFIILCSFQGLAVAVSNLTTKQVSRAFRNRRSRTTQNNSKTTSF